MAAASRTLHICLLILMSPLLIYGEDQPTGPLYYVGENSGWTPGINWPHPGQIFIAGGVLVFKYSPGAHNVVRVDVDGYNTCTLPASPEVYSSGLDFVTLNPGDNYFICGVAGHCSDAGMKIVVTTE